MRAAYAAQLQFEPEVTIAEVVEVVGAWPCRGQAPAELRESLEPGTRSYALPEADHTLDVEVLESAAGILWRANWQHPHSDDPDLKLISELSIAGPVDGPPSFTIAIRPVWARPAILEPRFSMRAPRVVRDLVARFVVDDAGRRLTAERGILDAEHVEGLVYGLLLNDARTRPVVLVTTEPTTGNVLVDPSDLARELAGLAHVLVTEKDDATWRLSEFLGRLGCWGGAMRIWWPGLTLDDDPARHRLYSSRALREWKGLPPAQHAFRIISAASASSPAIASHALLQRQGREAQLKGKGEEEWLEELIKIEETLKEERLARAGAERESEQKEIELNEERSAKEQAEREAEKLASALLVTDGGADTVASALTPPRTALEAVEVAQPLCPHLRFADRAFESAAASPYQYPADVLGDLLRLEQLASAWASPGGLGKQDLAARARELGLDWKTGVSVTTVGKNPAQYRFTWEGEIRQVGPHVRRNRGKGAGKLLRIYLYKHEPKDSKDRRLVVAHVGRKLEDTTT